ncbi:MAG TPA: hypothetical protein HPP94_16005 [Desulfuromonadales bacterium]|nr:hypothetical protein [Desulfuromonadales bacterium]
MDWQNTLKNGAVVMVNKNTSTLVNGQLGIVISMDTDSVTIAVNNTTHRLSRVCWESFKYIRRRNGDIEQVQDGTAEQIPLRLAWAVTVHKAQGQTYERVRIDTNNRAPFVSGQINVALSRCKTIEGLQLAHSIVPNDLRVDEDVINFHTCL